MQGIMVRTALLAALFSSLATALIFGFLMRGTGPDVLPDIPNTGSIPSIVEQVSDSVVSVVVTKNLPVIERRIREVGPYGIPVPYYAETGSEEVNIGGGSGFVVEGGYIVTNRHIVADAGAAYTVVTDAGERLMAEVVYRDEEEDIAVLHIDARLEPLEFRDSDDVRVGETVIAIGNALARFSNTVSVGVVSGLERTIAAIDPVAREIEEIEEAIQTDAAINRGNSGGPLLDSAGRVIGMNVAVSLEGENIGFAIPANKIRAVLQRL
jgi:S1-C subfamily serine protease